METKEEMMRKMNDNGLGWRYDEYEIGYHFTELKFADHNFHPLYYRIKMLYDLLREKNGPHHYVNSILLNIQEYGIEYKVKKVDLIAMNKLYRKYK